MEWGRSGRTSQFKGDPMWLPLGDSRERFRIGRIGSWSKRETYPGKLLPIDAYQ